MHQPTFLPWLGWWDKLVRADIVVLLDDVQFPKKGGTWMNRVRVLVNGIPTWLTVPVDRGYHGVRRVREMRIGSDDRWRGRIAKTLATAYARSPYFDEVQPVVEQLLQLPTDRIAELNEHAIRRIADRLCLDTTKLVHQSSLHTTEHSTDLLIELCKAVGGTVYMTGDGSDEYLETQKFAPAGLRLEVQGFTSPRYRQAAETFVPGLSIVDALMSCGWEGTATLLRERG